MDDASVHLSAVTTMSILPGVSPPPKDRPLVPGRAAPDPATTTRRRFLEVAGAAVTFAACGGKGGATEASGDVAAGNVSALGVGELHAVAGHPVAIARDKSGVYAMSTICTHEQCDMTSDGSVTSNGLSCSCHGSTFDPRGNPTGGPAGSPLKHFSVEIAKDGSITIHASVAVSGDTRVAVP